MLELQDLTKIYNAGTVTEMTLFDHFNLTVPDGQFVSIVGSNGSGKTSLLNILCGSIPLDGGDVRIDGKSIRKMKDYQRYATMGRVYQNPSLGTSPNLTMLENLSLADNKGKSFGLGFGVNKKRIDFYRSELAALGLGLEDIRASCAVRQILAWKCYGYGHLFDRIGRAGRQYPQRQPTLFWNENGVHRQFQPGVEGRGLGQHQTSPSLQDTPAEKLPGIASPV